MNHTCIGAGVVLVEQLNLYLCFLGLYILPNHEHMWAFFSEAFLLQNWRSRLPISNFLSIISNAVMYSFNSFVFSYG